jgi:hypothetical protein
MKVPLEFHAAARHRGARDTDNGDRESRRLSNRMIDHCMDKQRHRAACQSRSVTTSGEVAAERDWRERNRSFRQPGSRRWQGWCGWSRCDRRHRTPSPSHGGGLRLVADSNLRPGGRT